MKVFDPHIHMISRTTDDYQNMQEQGIYAVCEPAFWLGQPRTSVGSFEDYFLSLVGWERFRASQFGIHHFCTIGLNPKEANNKRLAVEVMELLPRYLEKESVIGVGEIGFDDLTMMEEKIFMEQISLAMEFELPILIHTPHRDKKEGTSRTISIVKESGIRPEMVLVDHNTEETIRSVLEGGYYAGHSIYPNTKMSPQRMADIVKCYGTERIVINSAADWGVSSPLMVPRTIEVMRENLISDEDIEQIVWKNPIGFFSQSGRLDFTLLSERPKIDQSQLHCGNSILRGQEPYRAKGDELL
ncbi:MAG: TatD family hydrolase [Bdellovibrionota bacterium]